METSCLKIGSILIVTFQSNLRDEEMIKLKNDIIQKVKENRATGVIIDVTVLDLIDSFASRVISNLAEMIRLCGAYTVMVGIHPSAAYAMVQLGLTFTNVETALDVDDGLELLKKHMEEPDRNG